MMSEGAVMMQRNDWERELRRDAFRHTYARQDGPNASYPDHTHPVRTAHVILEGEMTLTSEGCTRTYKAGERFDVTSNTIHSARMGPAGCRYLIGEE
jgi:mannose-6-phosphate isomerase-like protein (cupin superfamily)